MDKDKQSGNIMNLTRYDLEIGKEIFEVSIKWTANKRPYLERLLPLVIVSKPRYSDFEKTYIVEVSVKDSDSGEIFERNLRDMNVMRNDYNLNRWFETREDAVEYAERIHQKKLTYDEQALIECSEPEIKKEQPKGFGNFLKNALSF